MHRNAKSFSNHLFGKPMSLRKKAAQYYCYWGIGMGCLYMQSPELGKAKKQAGAPYQQSKGVVGV